MLDWRSQFTGLLVPLLCGGLVGGTVSMPQSSCLTSPPISSETSWEREAESSYLIRGYLAVDKEDLFYSIEVMEKLWSYFVEEAESFTPEEVAVIDKEFWNLG